jgi:methionyl-tRNA formyltransferase
LIVLEAVPAEMPPSSKASVGPGTILIIDNKRLMVQAGDGMVEIRRLQPEGRRAMTAAEFLAGYPVRSGDRFET